MGRWTRDPVKGKNLDGAKKPVEKDNQWSKERAKR